MKGEISRAGTRSLRRSFDFHHSQRLESAVMKRIFMLCFSLALLAVTALGQSATLDDASDWWSVTGEDPHSPNVKPSTHELARSNFTIAGVTLDGGGIEAITAKLGEASVVTGGMVAPGGSRSAIPRTPRPLFT